MTRTNPSFSKYLAGLSALLFVLLISPASRAQCGSEGDPIVNITFGTTANPDFGDGTTTYWLNESGQLTDGEYKLGSNINQGRSSWHNLRDHTDSDGEGMMLIVNASYDEGEFYRIRVRGLCERTTFVFSAWIAVANPPTECRDQPGGLQLPNVRFVIENTTGTAIASRSTGNIPASLQPQWIPFEFVFDTGTETEFDIVLINDNPGGCGNDLAIDDIQFRPCGPEITLDMDVTLKQADTLFFCEDDVNPMAINGAIQDDNSYAAAAAFQWQTRQDEQSEWTDMMGENENELSVMPSHNQWYRLTAAASTDNLNKPLCRISSDSIRFAQIRRPPDVTTVEPRGPICDDGSVLLDPPPYTGAAVGPVTYQWQVDEGNGAVDVPDATAPTYEFQARAAGTVQLRRWAINVCGDRFITHTFEVEVMETVLTTFTLPQEVICADDQPLLLSGGVIINGAPGMQGVYSGPGVSGGYFNPATAGVGKHIIAFSPPTDVRCAEPSQATITVYDTIFLEPMIDAVILPGQTITLNPQTNATQFSWSHEPGLANYLTQNPVASPSETTTYTLTASNEAGCEKMGEVTIIVLQDLIVPNSFTPNGDGVNDTWEIDGLENYPNAFVQVFNRWGTLVFSSKGYSTSMAWSGQFNGKDLPVGTYYYTLSSDVLTRALSGSVTILR